MVVLNKKSAQYVANCMHNSAPNNANNKLFWPNKYYYALNYVHDSARFLPNGNQA